MKLDLGLFKQSDQKAEFYFTAKQVLLGSRLPSNTFQCGKIIRYRKVSLNGSAGVREH